MEHAADGLFSNAPIVTWTRGQNEEVYWKTGAGHQGGYAYRLCKVPQEGAIHLVTEKCFNDGHLKFAGDISWVYKGIGSEEDVYDPSKWEAMPLLRVTTGTFPEGSEWAKIPVPKHDDGGWGIKDLVEVPADLEPGHYVLSFRWDCKKSPQIWNSCANINII